MQIDHIVVKYSLVISSAKDEEQVTFELRHELNLTIIKTWHRGHFHDSNEFVAHTHE